MTLRIACLVVIVSTLSVVPAVSGNAEKVTGAILSAEQWLAMVDEGNYARSWKEAAELFRDAVTQGQWEQSLHGVRKPLGKLMSRKVTTTTYRTSLPGAPDGEYVVVEFTSSFEKKKSAVETVTPMMDKDGKWRVSGYYIK